MLVRHGLLGAESLRPAFAFDAMNLELRRVRQQIVDRSIANLIALQRKMLQILHFLQALQAGLRDLRAGQMQRSELRQGQHMLEASIIDDWQV
jgi:hypothetical protein